MKATASAEKNIAVHMQLLGDVQGYGIRPTVANLAMRHDLTGSVRNSRQGVELSLQGDARKIDAFRELLRCRFPHAIQNVRADVDADPTFGFQILESISEGEVQFSIPRDRVICDDCLQECQTPSDRRFGYALNGCVQCGPRYSIISAMPYDRSRTSMSSFSMCRECQVEFAEPTHRRFHAQTNCCPVCGPKVWYEVDGQSIEDSCTAIEASAEAIRQGSILALKGLGGYQLICDATNAVAVARLRDRKKRLSKPFAVMVASMGSVNELADFDEQEEDALRGPAGPIVLLRSKPVNGLAQNVHAGFRSMGVMLPTTALHWMLLNATRVPMVVTSANIEGEPLEYREEEATQRLSRIADGFLHHNRPILNPIDDSVVQAMAGRIITLRAARGLAPLPIDCPSELQILGLGGQQKSAMALSNGRTSVLGPHVGDLDTVQSRERFVKQNEVLKRLMNCDLPSYACDQHPDYFTSRLACDEDTVKYQAIQHHHAHIVSAMVEHGYLGRTVLGFAFDGTGLGSDESIWGGEVLVADATTFRRVGNLRPFPLLGGEVAIKEPWRTAISLLTEAVGQKTAALIVEQNFLSEWHVERSQMERVLILADHESLSIKTSSMGRLFDGLAALVCGIGKVTFEGEAAMRLESICNADAPGSYHFHVGDEAPIIIDWRPMVRELVSDLAQHLPVGIIAMKFHRAIATCIATIALRFSELPVVLAGGVFQNRTLVELVDGFLQAQSTQYVIPCKIPPNDGGLAVGQLAVAASRREKAACA
jgi:hydrogenase maturation protein HypF